MLVLGGQIPKAELAKGGALGIRNRNLSRTRRLVVYLPADSFSVPNALGTWKVF